MLRMLEQIRETEIDVKLQRAVWGLSKGKLFRVIFCLHIRWSLVGLVYGYGLVTFSQEHDCPLVAKKISFNSPCLILPDGKKSSSLFEFQPRLWMIGLASLTLTQRTTTPNGKKITTYVEITRHLWKKWLCHRHILTHFHFKVFDLSELNSENIHIKTSNLRFHWVCCSSYYNIWPNYWADFRKSDKIADKVEMV